MGDSVAVHPRVPAGRHAPPIYDPPTPTSLALGQVDVWLESPSVVLLTETEGHWRYLRSLLQSGRLTGAGIHDARVAALCFSHGVRELWTADRDFGRFPSLVTRNPLTD